MIKGMTGFGSVQYSNGQVKALVEVKTLNHRYLDINYFLPIGFGSMEEKLRQLIQKGIQRGRVSVSIKITQKPAQSVAFNKSVAENHLKFAKKLGKELHLNNDLTLSDIMKLPGVLETKDSIVDPQKLWTGINVSLKRVLRDVIAMRSREGRSLSIDIRDKLSRMSIQIRKIQARHKAMVKDKKKKLNTEEFQSFQKGSDINEEISRFKHYIDEVRVLLQGKIPVGKKLDFIAQEMQRETNTIGSKLQDKVVSNAVIALKSKIEKIREQAQNIE